MKIKLLLSIFICFLLCFSFKLKAQEEFNMDDFAAADDTEIKNFCNSYGKQLGGGGGHDRGGHG